MDHRLAAIVKELEYILEHPVQLKTGVPKIQEQTWKVKGVEREQNKWEVLRDLAYDLDYYEPHPTIRRENRSFFGEGLTGDSRSISDSMKRMLNVINVVGLSLL
jgi:hypothetical protein